MIFEIFGILNLKKTRFFEIWDCFLQWGFHYRTIFLLRFSNFFVEIFENFENVASLRADDISRPVELDDKQGI